MEEASHGDPQEAGDRLETDSKIFGLLPKEIRQIGSSLIFRSQKGGLETEYRFPE